MLHGNVKLHDEDRVAVTVICHVIVEAPAGIDEYPDIAYRVSDLVRDLRFDFTTSDIGTGNAGGAMFDPRQMAVYVEPRYVLAHGDRRGRKAS